LHLPRRKISSIIGFKTENAEEKFCCIKQLGMAVGITALLKGFDPPVTD
jgi:hypothetical protein